MKQGPAYVIEPGRHEKPALWFVISRRFRNNIEKAICHCYSKSSANKVKLALNKDEARKEMFQWHPKKTK